MKTLKVFFIAGCLFNARQTAAQTSDHLRDSLITGIMKEEDGASKEHLYKSYRMQFPVITDSIKDEELKVELAKAYLNNDRWDDFRRVAATLKDKQALVMPIAFKADAFQKQNKELAKADALCKQVLAMVGPLFDQPQASVLPSQVQQNNRNDYAHLLDVYAAVLFKEQKLNEALKYEEQARTYGGGDADHYVTILDALGRKDDVIEEASPIVKSGWASDAVKELLKKNYVSKYNEPAYNKFLAELHKQAKEDIREKLALTIINQPAPDFKLVDMDGKTVSLKSLRGKTVVLDFWATWCSPCKASFPGMQIALNTYKNDPNIVFLFIDTRETAENYKELAKQYIDENKYPFHVLFDEKTESGKQNKVLTAYGVTGIPTKFFIDKNGNIRFKHVGYYGSTDNLVYDVTNMIELTQQAAGTSAAAPEAGTDIKVKSK